MTTSRYKPKKNFLYQNFLIKRNHHQQAFSTVFQNRINKTALGQLEPSINKNNVSY